MLQSAEEVLAIMPAKSEAENPSTGRELEELRRSKKYWISK